jgi:hypothetical protein
MQMRKYIKGKIKEIELKENSKKKGKEKKKEKRKCGKS